MARRSLLGSVVGLAVGAVTHPVGTAGRVLGTAKSAAGVGFTVVGKVLEHVSSEAGASPAPAKSAPAESSAPAPAKPAAAKRSAPAPAKPAPTPVVAPNTVASDDSLEPPATLEPDEVSVTPADVAQMVAKKAPAKKAAAKKTPAKTAAAKKAPAKKAAPRTAQEVVDGDDLEVTTSVGTTGAGEPTNPDTTRTAASAGAEQIVDPATAKAVRSEADVMRKAAERDPSDDSGA